jgi:hypothetical protein
MAVSLNGAGSAGLGLLLSRLLPLFLEEPTTIYRSLRKASILSSVAGCVDKKPPPPSPPEVRISHVSVSIMTSLE